MEDRAVKDARCRLINMNGSFTEAALIGDNERCLAASLFDFKGVAFLELLINKRGEFKAVGSCKEESNPRHS